MSRINNFRNRNQATNKSWLQKNALDILIFFVLGIFLINPDAKSFLLQKVMLTGLFNPKIESSTSVEFQQTDFDFVDENGLIQNTSALRGKVIFINFWASWCPPCRAEFPSIEKFYTEMKDNPNLFFLMLNEDTDLKKGKDFLAKERFTTPIFQTKSQVSKQLYSGSLPTTIIIDKTGKVRFHHVGFADYSSKKFVKQLKEILNE